MSTSALPVRAGKYSDSVSVTVRVPAKINVYLGVGAAKANGYHDLATVFQSIAIYDEVTVADSRELTLEVSGEWSAGVPTDETNLAWQAAVKVAERYGRPPLLHMSKAQIATEAFNNHA